MKLKVAQINSCYGIYSTGTIVKDISAILQKQGHECISIFGRSGAANMIDSFKFSTKFDTNYHTLMSRAFDREGLYSVKPTKRIIKLLKEYSPDIIHLHNIHGHYLNYKLLFEFIDRQKIPVVWTLHDCWSITGHCAHFDKISCDKWTDGCKNCPQKKSYPTSYLIDNSSENYALKKELFTSVDKMTIVTPSNWLKSYIDRSYLGKYETIVIHNGVDISVFKRAESNIRQKYSLENKKIVLGVANVWDKMKGLYDFIKLSDMLGADYKTVLIGLSDAQTELLPKNILGLKKIADKSELAKWYTAADVFVNPTYEDTFPTVNIEAQCCGTPVVTYMTGGSPETIYNGCGMVVEQGNISDLIKALDAVISNEISAECRTEFDKNLCFLKYISVYEKMLQQKGE